jgi:class 3 adenylate cyclase
MYQMAHTAYTRAMAKCLRCGAFVADSSRFCGECGAPVGASLRPRQELRKTVTILFCDVVDSTVLGEQSDPETVRHAMSRYFDEMRTIVEQLEARLLQDIPDRLPVLAGGLHHHPGDRLAGQPGGQRLGAPR